jgi:hypothetical protein
MMMHCLRAGSVNMTNGDGSLKTSEELVEIRGCLSRTDWELVYLAARKFAQAHGLSIARFDLQSAEVDGQRQAMDAPTLAVCLSDRTPNVGD